MEEVSIEVNELIKISDQKVSQLTNQNILLEAKLKSLLLDYQTLKEEFDNTQSTAE